MRVRAADGERVSKIIEPLRGVHDVLPAQIAAWQHLENCTREVFSSYGYEEFRVPDLIEQTQLFKRSIGDFTDIVEKEMFSFVDQGEDHITLRPEATAGIVRAVISNGLLRENRLRVWCMGPMFRRERPQAGRYRPNSIEDRCGSLRFRRGTGHRRGNNPALSARLLKPPGTWEAGNCWWNSLGTPQTRALSSATISRPISKRTKARSMRTANGDWPGNPLRILDSKNPEVQRIVAGAPTLLETLDPESKLHFESLCAQLKSANIDYHIEPHLVRWFGLLHAHCVRVGPPMPWKETRKVCGVRAGGRYDNLVAQLGGTPTPGIGWAMGQERIVMLLEKQGLSAARQPAQVYLVLVGAQAEVPGFRLAEQLRDAWPQLRLTVNLGGGNFKSQFKRADKSGAEYALVLGDDEVARGTVAIKALRQEMAQEECPLERISERLGTLLGLRGGRAE